MELLKIEFSHLSELLGNENGAGSRDSGVWFLKGVRKGWIPPCWYGFQENSGLLNEEMTQLLKVMSPGLGTPGSGSE